MSGRIQSVIKGPHYLAAARLTFAALVLHVTFICVQVGVKLALKLKVKERKKLEPNYVYNSYTSDDPNILIANRLVGNYMEWMPVFLGMVWLYAMYVGNPGYYGWIYLFFRSLYAPLAFSGAISRGGAKPLIYISTMPQYLMIIGMALPIVYALFVPYDDFS